MNNNAQPSVKLQFNRTRTQHGPWLYVFIDLRSLTDIFLALTVLKGSERFVILFHGLISSYTATLTKDSLTWQVHQTDGIQ